MKTVRLVGLAFLVLGAAALFFAGSFIYKHFSWDSVGDIMTVSETLEKQKPEAPKYLEETGILIVSTSYGAREDLDRHILWSLEYVKEELGYKNTLAILKDVNNFDQLQLTILRLEGEGVKRIIVVPLFASAENSELQVLSYMLNTQETTIGKLRLADTRKIKHLKSIFVAEPLCTPMLPLPACASSGDKINKYVEESIEKGLKHFGVIRHKTRK